MKRKWNVWHNNYGEADQYFVCKGYNVKFQIPRFIGKLFCCTKPKKEKGE